MRTGSSLSWEANRQEEARNCFLKPSLVVICCLTHMQRAISGGSGRAPEASEGAFGACIRV